MAGGAGTRASWGGGWGAPTAQARGDEERPAEATGWAAGAQSPRGSGGGEGESENQGLKSEEGGQAQTTPNTFIGESSKSQCFPL